MIEFEHHKQRQKDFIQGNYNELYREGSLLQRDSFYLWLISLLKPIQGKLLLDISCGQGRLVTLAASKGLRGMGIDFAVEGVRIGQKDTPSAHWLVANGENLPLMDGSVDYVTHIGSLEHYLHPASGAKEIARVLHPHGKACVLLPNAFGLWGNIPYVLRHGEVFDDGQPLQRYATRQTWAKMLEDAGLRIDRTLGYSEVDLPRTQKDLIWLLKRPQKIVRRFLNVFIPLNFSYHFVFLCSHA